MYDKIAIIGYSGHAYVVLDAAIKNGVNIRYYCEKNRTNNNPYSLDYLGFESDKAFKGWNNDYAFVLGIGDNKLRHRIGLKVLEKKRELLSVIHPSASLSDQISLGKGIFIARQVSVNALAEIGDFCILNTGCVVEHECVVKNGVHIAPGAVLAGNVEIGENTFVGANAVIKQGVKIGANSIIGAGTVVLKDIGDNKKVVGNPGKEI